MLLRQLTVNKDIETIFYKAIGSGGSICYVKATRTTNLFLAETGG